MKTRIQRAIRRVSLRWRLTLLLVAVASIGIVAMAVDTVRMQVRGMEEKLESTLEALGAVVLPDARLALQLDNPDELRQALADVCDVDWIQAAAVYAQDGGVTRIAAAVPDPATGWLPAPRWEVGFSRSDQVVEYWLPFAVEDLTLGRRPCILFVRASRERIRAATTELVWRSAAGSAVVLVVLSLATMLLVGRLTAPVVELADIARRVQTQRDFRVRAIRRSSDEVGQLVDAFNDMLEEIRLRDEERAGEANRLEAEVARRTVELECANSELTVAKQKAEAALVTRSQLLANVSHEIRTPMSAVIGMSELVLETPLSPEQRELLGIVRQSGEALLGIIEGILDFAKVDAGRVELMPESVVVRDLIADVVRPLAVRAEASGFDLVADVAGDVPERVVCDPLRVKQVLTNLVGNAIKFTEQGCVAVKVACAPVGTEGGDRILLLFAVEDSGIGIPAERLETVFEAFRQADGSTTRRYGGTGLGLTISRDLARLMEGELVAESTPGEGSTFTFTLPVVAETPPPARPKVGSGCRALLALDLVGHRRALAAELRGCGFELVEMGCSAARDAIAAGEAAGFDLVVLEEDGRPWPSEWLDGLAPAASAFAERAAIRLVRPQHVVDGGGATFPGIDLLWPFRVSDLHAAITMLCNTETGGSQDVGSDGLGAASASVATPQDAVGDDRPSPESVELVRRRGRVLVAEDNAVNQRFVTAVLTRAGVGFDLVENGARCVEVFVERLSEGERHDLILMDMQMPVLDGPSATRRIRAIEAERGEGVRIPIVALTANVAAEDRQACLDAGMDGFLTKPIRAAQLFEAIERYQAAEDGAVQPSGESSSSTEPQ
jgi:two-component system sensor histidine kinase/response regulator